MKKLLPILLVTVLMVSCFPENEPIETIQCFPKEGAVALVQESSESEITEYCYNEDGTIKIIATRNESYNSNQAAYHEFSYNESGQIDSIFSFIPGILYLSSMNAFDHTIERVYTYNSEGNIEEIKQSTDYNFQNGTVLIEYSKFEYDDKGRIKTETTESESTVDGQLIKKVVGYSLFTYDENDNIIEDSYYANNDSIFKLSSVSIYEYDENDNPFNIFPGKHYNNNITHVDIMSFYDNDTSNYIVDYLYEYDEMDRPSIKETYIDSIFNRRDYIGYYDESE